ncbi:hypothetical protein yinte0001_19290 [Yersinia intermedia ATCC 29909]|nr:hypothetical protein yinte0001_19290 [Yersinia intermedia ATCC 29909]
MIFNNYFLSTPLQNQLTCADKTAGLLGLNRKPQLQDASNIIFSAST